MTFYNNLFLKVKNTKVVRDSFQFMLVLLVMIFFTSQFRSNYRWGYRFFGKHGYLCTNENAWRKSGKGDLAAYSVFLKKHLFTEADPEQVLVVPDMNKTNVPFARKFWLGVSPLYLFPAKIKVSSTYKFEIDAKEMKQLKCFDSITSVYRNRRYHLLTGLSANNYSKWAIYIHEAGKTVDIFTLPFEYKKD